MKEWVNDVVFWSCSGVKERPVDVLFIHLSQDRMVDAVVTTYASTQAVFVSHAAVVTHEKMYDRLPWSALTAQRPIVQ